MCSAQSIAMNHSQLKKIKHEDIDDDLKELLKIFDTTLKTN